MRCCIPYCKNDSRRISKSQGITFHVFPTEPNLRSAWLKAVGKEKWSPRDRSAVCSEHFIQEDLYDTKSGLRKVRTGAVPIVVQDTTNCIFEDPEDLKVCRICLDMNNRLLEMEQYRLSQAFEDLTGLTLCGNDNLPQKLCVECAQRLMSCDKLRKKSLRANSLLLDIVKKQNLVTVENIKTIDRDINGLASILTVKHFGNDKYDLEMEHTDTIEVVEPVKDENAVFINTDVVIKEEVNNIGNSDIEGGVNYSSDDSLPLETQRKKKKVKEKKETRRVKKKLEQVEPKIDRRRKPFLNNDLNETLFTITDLSFEEQVAEIQKRRESSNYKNSIFKCIECFKGFLDEDAYNGHMTRHTNQCGEYECEICKTHFKQPHALRKHITAHHTQRFSCNQCPYITTHRQTARLHERWHKGTKYQCPHCPDEFVKFTTYMGHVRIKHPSDFVCCLCGFSFVSQKGIDLHKKLKHRLDSGEVPEDGPFCESCNVRFLSQEAYKRHLNLSARHSTDDSDANKSRKGRRSKDKERDKRQERESSDKKRMYPSQLRRAEGPIPCEQCGMQLEDSRAYHGHFRRMHPDKNRTNYPSMKTPCMCEVCGKMFQSAALLRDHRWTHTGERPFACESCGKSFRMRQRLVAHRRVHAPRRAYACAVCGKGFSTHSNRQRHMFIHTGLKPFKCEMCGKCFKHASEKRAHITYVHLKKPWPKRARAKARRADRPGPLGPHAGHAAAGELDMVPPLWPGCDPKLDAGLGEDKPMYYNLKI